MSLWMRYFCWLLPTQMVMVSLRFSQQRVSAEVQWPRGAVSTHRWRLLGGSSMASSSGYRGAGVRLERVRLCDR